MNTTAISLQDLYDPEIESKVNINRSHITIQVIRNITPRNGSNSASIRYYQRNVQQQLTFTRIYMCRYKDELCYLMINREQNKRIFHRDLQLRDNGTVTIGTFMRVLAPHPIERTMQDIPMIRSDSPAVVLQTPSIYDSYPVNFDIEGNGSGVAVLNGANVSVARTFVTQTTCTGKHCDRQRVHEVLNQGCGCWGTSGIGISNLALVHTIVVDDGNIQFTMRSFSSNRFNLDIFQDRNFCQNVPVTALEHTDASDNLEDSIEECSDLINNNGGFTVVVWYSRGEINDKSLIGMNLEEEDAHADSGRMNYHIVQILPTNREFLNDGTTLNTMLKFRKFKVGDIA